MTPTRRQTTCILLPSLVGTSVEFYDFYIHPTVTSLVVGLLFFPSRSASAQLLSSHASFGLAFLAHPVGGILFGRFDDRIERKFTPVPRLELAHMHALGRIRPLPGHQLELQQGASRDLLAPRRGRPLALTVTGVP